MTPAQLTAVVYAGGHPLKVTAFALGITNECAKSRLRKVRRDYQDRGIEAGTVLQLGAALRADGLLRDGGA